MINQFVITTQRDAQGRFAVIHTDGYINNLAGERIGEEANTLLAEGFRRIVINMAKSTVINSIGISILIEVIEKMQEIDGTLAFCNLTKTIAKTFTIMGLAQYALIYDNEQEAVRGVLE
ncbi:MAG: anti-anti-sigma factor [Cyanobacteria bacterium RYN_339]|nr:anti-anti-sigma factor [Cyanobacteria bacterium RYN_339]